MIKIFKKIEAILFSSLIILTASNAFAIDNAVQVARANVSDDFYNDKLLFEVEKDNEEDKNQDVSEKKSLKNFLKTAMMPVGKTMYVWGGGWNKEDTGAGKEARSIGLAKSWGEFAKKQDKNYNYKKTLFQIQNGLDCSGYVGWVIYNVFNYEDGKDGYVMLAQKMAKEYAKMGFGTFTAAKSVKDYRPDDIMSSKSHVYIVVGTCSDKSLVVVHSSPPGVQINGTVNSKGQKNSEAKKLAEKYMKKYFPSWYAKYPPKTLEMSYLKGYDQMRWNVRENGVLSDEENLSKMNAEEVLKVLFDE